MESPLVWQCQILKRVNFDIPQKCKSNLSKKLSTLDAQKNGHVSYVLP